MVVLQHKTTSHTPLRNKRTTYHSEHTDTHPRQESYTERLGIFYLTFGCISI